MREHGMILATTGLTYSVEKLSGVKATLAAGGGMYLDRFVAQADPGLLVLHGFGNVLQRQLGPDESIQIEPGGFLYKDSSERMEMHVEFPHAGVKLWRSWGNRYLWVRLHGPGRVALQSSYDRLEDPGTDFQESCNYTQHLW